MKFRQATANNVAENRAKLSPKLQEELKKKEEMEETPVVEEKKPVPQTGCTADQMKVILANTAKEAQAIISVNLRLEPHLNAEILCTLFPGIKVMVNELQDEPEWCSLTYQGRDCFVKKEYIKFT